MPANTRDIRRRIKSIKNTAQITNAMHNVASAKRRRAQNAALAGRPYAELINRVLVSVREHTDVTLHPLLAVRPVGRELVVVVSTDKGLCGALNTNLLREAALLEGTRSAGSLMEGTRLEDSLSASKNPGSPSGKSPITPPGKKTAYVSAGRKGQQALARMKRDLVADFQLPDAPTLADTKALTKFCVEQFLSGKVDQVSLLYTRFVNTLTQTPTKRVLLPISPFDLPQSAGKSAAKAEAKGPESAKAAAAPESPATDGVSEYIYEPGAAEVLSSILPHYLSFETYQMILDARASEHSARMIAMKNATDNAHQLIKDLTLEYNKVRQAGITTELLEISTAQIALG